ncbi:MAG: hypothetical protein JXR89_00875 [Deltaproteobacteria bacterium]|nr:hypothetical protein [Deltaproteobacteria bacterium]
MARKNEYFHPLCKLTWNNIRRHPYINLISISIISFALLLLALYYLGYVNATRIFTYWRADLCLAVYLDDDLDPLQLGVLRAYCRDLPEVAAVSYVTRSEALANFRRTLGQDAGFLEGLTENPLPASLELKLDSAVAEVADVERLARQLERQAGVSEVEYGSRWLRHLFSFFKVLKYFGLLFTAFLSAVTVFIVANTIRLTLYARRETVRVLYLVGAHPWFISLPYFFEGMFQGSVAALLALAAAYGGYRYFRGWLLLRIPEWGLSAQVHFFDFITILIFLAFGTLLGVAGFLVSSNWLRRLK